jgi:prepilin-type N-terminal cleavage/methylation domain-containing protein
LLVHRQFKKRGFTLIEVMIVVLVISILAMVAVPAWQYARQRTQERACEANRTKMNDAKAQWMAATGAVPADEPTMADLVPTYIKEIPRCPRNGTYTIGNGNTRVSCSVHGQ